MKHQAVRKNWSRDELIVAFNLYCKTPFTKIDSRNKEVKELSILIGRSPSSVALKLVNFARLDPALQERNISGMRHGSKQEVVIWNEFNSDWDDLAYQSERILARYRNEPVENSVDILPEELTVEGREREALVKTRVNQSFFRNMILASYNNRCCITGISEPSLLVASHIMPWAEDKKSRMNPCNGLCLNALHDRAFDNGLITITPDYIIRVSDAVKAEHSKNSVFFGQFDGKKITLPQRFMPSKEFLQYHNANVFKGRL